MLNSKIDDFHNISVTMYVHPNSIFEFITLLNEVDKLHIESDCDDLSYKGLGFSESSEKSWYTKLNIPISIYMKLKHFMNLTLKKEKISNK
jgi:hypothetical protein